MQAAPARQAKSWRDTWWWKLLSDISTVMTLVPAFGVTWLLHHLKKMPALAANPVEYFAASGFVFFGTWTAGTSAVRLVRWATPRLKMWRNPPVLVVASSGGTKAAIQMTHYGEPACWEVRMRVIRSLEAYSTWNNYAPDPIWRLCYLCKDGNKYEKLILKNGDSANVIFASIYGGDIYLSHAEQRGTIRVGRTGLIIEAEIKSLSDKIIKCFKIDTDAHGALLTFEDIACEKPAIS